MASAGLPLVEQALKLAERTIQFADVKGILCDGYLRAGRVSHREGSLQDASSHFTKAKEARKDSVLATIGLAQVQLKNGGRVERVCAVRC